MWTYQPPLASMDFALRQVLDAAGLAALRHAPELLGNVDLLRAEGVGDKVEGIDRFTSVADAVDKVCGHRGYVDSSIKPRINEQRLTPMYVSVHATDRYLRSVLLGKADAGETVRLEADDGRFLAWQDAATHPVQMTGDVPFSLSLCT